jgi:hypothetical protein
MLRDHAKRRGRRPDDLSLVHDGRQKRKDAALHSAIGSRPFLCRIGPMFRAPPPAFTGKFTGTRMHLPAPMIVASTMVP